MAPCTYGGLAHGTASDGRIRLGNSEFINVNGPTPTYAIGPVRALYPGHLDAMASDGFAPRTAPNGRIPELAHPGGPAPSFALGSARLFDLKTWTLWPATDTLSERPLVAASRNYLTQGDRCSPSPLVLARLSVPKTLTPWPVADLLPKWPLTVVSQRTSTQEDQYPLSPPVPANFSTMETWNPEPSMSSPAKRHPAIAST